MNVISDVDITTFSKFIKIFKEKNGMKNVGICHPRINLMAKENSLRTITFNPAFKTCTKTFTNI